MIKRLTSILVLWCSLGIITVAGNSQLMQMSNDSQNKDDGLKTGKDEITKQINGSEYLNEEQKKKLIEELNGITVSSKLTEIENKVTVLNSSMAELIHLLDKVSIAYDDDISIRDNIGKDIFVNLRFKSKDIKGTKSFLSNLGSFELGAGYMIKDGIAKGLKIGGFVGYTGGTKYNQLNTGISFNYYDYTGLVRYRYNKINNFSINMLDVYNKYGYTNTIYDVILGVYGDLLLTNRFEAKYKDKRIVNNLSVNGGIGFNVGYDFKKLLKQDLKVILRQRIDLSYKRIGIEKYLKEYSENLSSIKPYNIFNYTVGIKVDYSYKNYGIALSSDVDIKLRTTSNISLSYMW